MHRVERTRLPDGFREFRAPGVVAWVQEDAEPWVADTLSSGRTLYQGSAAFHDPSTDLHGRRPLRVTGAGSSRAVVRRYARGGAVGPLLGERFLRAGVPRPLRELRASARVREAGILSPRVLAAAVYPGAFFYRGDLMTEMVGGASDLAACLFGWGGDPPTLLMPQRIPALIAVEAMIRTLAEQGIHHPDMNAKNLLVDRSDPTRVHLLDLDRCRTGRRPGEDLRRRMASRLRQSLAKWGARSGRPLAPEEWKAFDGAVGGPPDRDHG